ncbi:unnamed protein product [Phaeothamnion confervicola]
MANLVELQAVILASSDGARLYPLTEDTPLPLLPVLNRPLLRYQLDLLAKATFTQALIVLSEEGAAQTSRFLDEYDGPVQIRTATVDGSLDTADVLRQIRDKISGDFVVIPADIVCEEVLREMARMHRLRGADVTMLLTEEAPNMDPKGKKVARPKRDSEDVDCIGITPTGRVVIKLPALDFDAFVLVQKALLRRSASVVLSTRMQDVNVYIFSYGVLGFLEKHRHITNLQSELVPALVNRQFRVEADERLLPSRRASSTSGGQSAPGDALAGPDARLLAARSGGGAAAECELCLDGDALRCYALVLRHNPGAGPGRFCAQARTLAAYMNMNRDLMCATPAGEDCPWGPFEGLKRKDQVVQGADCRVAEKVVCKLSVLGKGCTVGARCKINSCVIMEGATVGENCTIQNSIVGANATIEDGCNLNDCQVAALTTVPAGTKAKQETFTRTTGGGRW